MVPFKAGQENVKDLLDEASRFPTKKFCRKSYQRLIEKKASTPLKSQGKWLAEDSTGNETVNWESTYSLLPFWSTKETKLREFQFKLLHRRIATNDLLYNRN